MSQSTNREQARRTYWNEHDRESYRCADCQRSRRQIRGRFEVHHKDGNPSNNDLSNLVGLCRLCHNLREEKKPSLNEIKQFRDQFATETPTVVPDELPVFQDNSKAGDYFRYCEQECIPCVRIFPRRKYARFEIDWISTSGWATNEQTEETTLGRNTEATLSKDAAEVVESIFEIKYSDKPTSKRGEYVANINPSTGLMFVPDIPIEPMKQFTREIWPTVMDERNWVPREEYR